MFSAKADPRWLGTRVFFVLLLLAAGATTGLAGCGGAEERPATWSFISTAIIEPSCATVNCHSALAQRASVDLSTREIGYRTLNAAIYDDAGAPLVIGRSFVRPGHPESSEIISLMHAQGTLRMPPDTALPEADIQLIADWITAGAANN